MISRDYSLNLMLSFILLYLNLTAAATSIAGKVLCAQSGLPLDGVRVASTTGKNSTTTDSDGLFLLATTGIPESTTVSSFYEYRMNILSSGKRERFITDEVKPLAFNLFDLKGQMIEHTVCRNADLRFPQKNLPSGTYLLQITGFKPERILITGRSMQGIVYKRRHPEIVFSKPDTIYFCKAGYRPCAAPLREINNVPFITLRKKRWVAADIHNHTVLTDGSYIQDSLLKHAFGEGGLDVYANSEHGGMAGLDTAGLPIAGDAVPRGVDGFSVPRWYSLTNYSWPKLLGQRTVYPGKILIQGVEWNCPGHEHASVGFVGDACQPDALAKFEYQFDASDYDTSISWLPKMNASEHSNALAALRWMQNNFPKSSYCFINHPSRASADMYSISAIRDFHALAPMVFLGLEGMPGHQKYPLRGGYSYFVPESSTWGGADYVIAKIGGVWDALLGEGRHLWVIMNSDFHYTYKDFWPGEYAKTWTSVTDSGAQAWLEGMRTGEIFIATGDLLSRLEFSIDDGIHDAPMGADLFCRSREPAVIIRFKETPVNNHGDTNHIDHIDLIAGRITAKKDPSNPVSYADPTNASTTCIRRFTSSDWITDNGWLVVRTEISCTQPMFYRLRGTNLAVGEPGEVDAEGNPLMDQAGANTEEIAWKDLWFYSDPVFVYPSW